FECIQLLAFATSHLSAATSTQYHTLSYTTLFRSQRERKNGMTLQRYQMTIFDHLEEKSTSSRADFHVRHSALPETGGVSGNAERSEEHTSELQSRFDLVCRLLPEKKSQR